MRTFPRKKTSGFTLVEIMVVSAISLMVTIGTMAFMSTLLRSYNWSVNKSLVTKDVRSFTMRMSDEVRAANLAFIYDSFAEADRTTNSDRRNNDGETGDCMILYFTKPHPDIDSPRYITKIVAYFRNAVGGGPGPVLRFQHEFAEADYVLYSETTATNNTEELALISVDSSGPYQEVVELSRGLANGRLFQSQGEGKLIIVNGEILHGNGADLNRETSNTYNLTLATRG